MWKARLAAPPTTTDLKYVFALLLSAAAVAFTRVGIRPMSVLVNEVAASILIATMYDPIVPVGIVSVLVDTLIGSVPVETPATGKMLVLVGAPAQYRLPNVAPEVTLLDSNGFLSSIS